MRGGRLRVVTKVLASLLRTEFTRSQPTQGDDGSTHDRQHQRARAVRRALEDLGPFYIKVGQMLSTRPDLVSIAVTEELAALHDQADPMPFAVFEPVLEGELGPEWRGRFRVVNTEHPLGTASLAQAYSAVLADGTSAVIKVQRPDVARTFHEDMALLRRAAKVVGRALPRLTEVVDFDAMLGVVFDSMRPELDFTIEARNMEYARPTVERFRTLTVPDVLFATRRVLVQGMSPGVSIRDVKHDALPPESRVAIGEDLLAFMHRGYFVDRVFHADPHPGNILVQDDGRAAVIDWGMVGRIDRRTSAALLLMLLNVALNDGTGVANAWLEVSRLTSRADVAAFVSDVTIMIPRLATASLGELDFGRSLATIMRHSAHRGIQVSPAVAILGKSFANIDGSVRHLAPEVRFTEVFQHHLESILLDLGKEQLSRAFVGRTALEALLGVTAAPDQLRGLLHNVGHRRLPDIGTGIVSSTIGKRQSAPWVVGAAALWLASRRLRGSNGK